MRKSTPKKAMKPDSNGYYRLRFTYEGKMYCVRGKTPEEAYSKKATKLASLERGEGKLDKTSTVAQWSSIWIETYLKPKVRIPGKAKDPNSMTTKSFQMYPEKLENYILPYIGKYRLKDITPTQLQMMLNAVAGKSTSTAKKVRMITKAMFKQAYSSRLIPFDPSTDLQLPYTTTGQRRSLTPEELKAFHEASKIHPQGLWFRLLLGTGIRPGEGYALQVKDFDFHNTLLHINKAVESGSNVVSSPKTKAGIRDIRIPQDLLLPLQAAFANKLPTDIAFPQMDGKTMKTASSGLNEWRSFFRTMDICAGAVTTWRGKRMTIATDGYTRTARGRILELDIDGENGHALSQDITMYYLRHTFCTNLQKADVDMFSAKYIMGHESIDTTARIYTHGNAETALLAGAKMDAWSAQNGQISGQTDCPIPQSLAT